MHMLYKMFSGSTNTHEKFPSTRMNVKNEKISLAIRFLYIIPSYESRHSFRKDRRIFDQRGRDFLLFRARLNAGKIENHGYCDHKCDLYYQLVILIYVPENDIERMGT